MVLRFTKNPVIDMIKIIPVVAPLLTESSPQINVRFY